MAHSAGSEALLRGYRDPESDKVIGYVAKVRDISEQKKAEDS
jgi:hypothetical protein